MFCPFQKYKSSLGEPNKGVHSYRFLDTAIVDYSNIVGSIEFLGVNWSYILITMYT